MSIQQGAIHQISNIFLAPLDPWIWRYYITLKVNNWLSMMWCYISDRGLNQTTHTFVGFGHNREAVKLEKSIQTYVNYVLFSFNYCFFSRVTNERNGSVSEAESEEENEEGDYTVYECPGLASVSTVMWETSLIWILNRFQLTAFECSFWFTALHYHSINLGVRSYSLHCSFVWPSPAKKKILPLQLILLAASQRFCIHSVIDHHHHHHLALQPIVDLIFMDPCIVVWLSRNNQQDATL